MASPLEDMAREWIEARKSIHRVALTERDLVPLLARVQREERGRAKRIICGIAELADMHAEILRRLDEGE